ncbi:hypothetical protein V492_03086 [Pseudogymnoascus sp. VKM F-4246]|nr:hypothetical protein V492_03086 [Pseudogymnoascus sp. VKM F-4246]
MSTLLPRSATVPQRPQMGLSFPPNGLTSLPAVPGFVSPELFTNFPPNAPAFFSTNDGSRGVRLVPQPAPQYAVRTNGPNDIDDRAKFYRDKYPQFVHSIQSLPIAWEDLYTYFDPLDIWMEGAGFCFHVIHRVAAANIEKIRLIESFVDEWSEANLAKLARVPPNTPVIAAFEPEDYQYFDFENLRDFEIADVCNFLDQRCYALQPQLQRIREGLVSVAEMEWHEFAPPVPTRSGPKTQIPWQEFPNPGETGLGLATTGEATNEYHAHRREVSFEKNRSTICNASKSQAKIEPVYSYNPRGICRNVPVALSRPIMSAFTPPRDLRDQALPNVNSQNHSRSGSKPEVNRGRAYSNVSRNQNFTTVRYEAASVVNAKIAIPDTQNLAGEKYYSRNSTNPSSVAKIDESRSIYIKGFTHGEFTSDLVPRMMECCGEIEGYKPMGEFAFMTFKNPKSAAEAIQRFDGFHDGRALKVAPYCRRKLEFDNWNGPNRHRGNSFRGNHRHASDYTGDSVETGEHRRVYKATGRDRNANVSNNGAQMPKAESTTPSRRHNTPLKHDFGIMKAHAEDGATPKGGKGHRPTSSGQSAKMTKSVDKGKLRSDSIPSIPTKKGSFAVSEDLSVPEEGRYGTSFSSHGSSFTHKGSIFDESPADALPDRTIKDSEGPFLSKECPISSGVISASPERREANLAPEGKKKKKKLKVIDSNAVVTASNAGLQSAPEMTGGVDIKALKFDSNNNDAGSLNLLEHDSKMRDKTSLTQPLTSRKDLAGADEVGGIAPLKKPARVIRGSPKKTTTDEGSPRSSKKKHGKTDSNASSFGIETRAKKYEGYELIMDESTNNSGEAPHSEGRNQTKTKFLKRNKSNVNLKENAHSESAPQATEVNILADPTHWPSLGKGKSSCQVDQSTAGHTTTGLLNPTPGGCLATARRNSMAAIISQKTRIVPAVPLLLRSVTMTEARSVSGDSAKSDDTIINVANTAGTRFWPAVVKWAGKPPSTEVVDNQQEVVAPASFP